MEAIESKLRRLAEQREEVTRERSRVTAETVTAVKEARAAGIPIVRIAEMAKLSRERVHRMLRDE